MTASCEAVETSANSTSDAHRSSTAAMAASKTAKPKSARSTSPKREDVVEEEVQIQVKVRRTVRDSLKILAIKRQTTVGNLCTQALEDLLSE